MAKEHKFTFYERLVQRWPLLVLGLFLCFGLEVLFRWDVIACCLACPSTLTSTSTSPRSLMEIFRDVRGFIDIFLVVFVPALMVLGLGRVITICKNLEILKGPCRFRILKRKIFGKLVSDFF